jgi:hypothetical protein
LLGRCPPERPCDEDLRAGMIAHWRKIYPGRLGWTKRLVTFARALGRHLVHGLPTASPPDQAARWAQCEPCEHRDRAKNACTKCGGCCLQVGALVSKITWAAESCPEKKWAAVAGEKAWTRAARWVRGKCMHYGITAFWRWPWW